MLRRLKARAKATPPVVRAVRATYPALAWLENRPSLYTRVAPYLRSMEFDEVRLGGRGNEPEYHLRRTSRMQRLAGADLLVLGVGGGDELALWRAQRPRSLTATDWHPGGASWRAHRRTRFLRADARRLPFGDGSFDVVASTALLEHIDGVEKACAEMARVTRPGGLIFANFGPLYYTHAGAHYHGAYEHLWMRLDAFEAYLLERNIPGELSEGLRWQRDGMFSRLRYDDYLAIFRRHFSIEHLTLGVSRDALRFRRERPEEWRALCARWDERDLLTFSMTVWLRPLARVTPISATAHGRQRVAS